eukprot:CAMPEP_0174715322 /NCGR_PEP_ID=MMETSP1094-20130205/21156_1 /TAXON_ID=156173 /ORGANISM="Chrysochromulina brevifilum, Strain UTEX LB 985" /LENGTH=141 /DNA_ID=CAMNT_0015914883 /DNA_START=229 /DNA_END=651 /DNA_ORIENTATION=+
MSSLAISLARALRMVASELYCHQLFQNAAGLAAAAVAARAALRLSGISAGWTALAPRFQQAEAWNVPPRKVTHLLRGRLTCVGDSLGHRRRTCEHPLPPYAVVNQLLRLVRRHCTRAPRVQRTRLTQCHLRSCAVDQVGLE